MSKEFEGSLSPNDIGRLFGNIEGSLKSIESSLKRLERAQDESRLLFAGLKLDVDNHEYRIKLAEDAILKLSLQEVKLSKRVSVLEKYFSFIFWAWAGILALLAAAGTLLGMLKG